MNSETHMSRTSVLQSKEAFRAMREVLRDLNSKLYGTSFAPSIPIVAAQKEWIKWVKKSRAALAMAEEIDT
jgi:hypothetical protein